MNIEDFLPHLQRVVAEKRELDDKIYLLTSFINKQNFTHHVEFAEQERLKRQLKAMEAYSDILGERLAAH